MAPPNDAPDALGMLPELLRRLAERGLRKRFAKGHRLIEEGDHGDTIFIILSGRVRAFGSDDSEHEITYNTYRAGQYFGEISLDGGPRSASVTALEACECAVVTRQTVRQYISECPEFAFELIASVIRLARDATMKAKQLALKDVYGRLVLLLGSLSVPQGDGTRVIAERLTHQEMANRLGCSREMVSRLMKDLEAGGYLRHDSSTTTVIGTLPARW